jgi:hypothetical protein
MTARCGRFSLPHGIFPVRHLKKHCGGEIRDSEQAGAREDEEREPALDSGLAQRRVRLREAVKRLPEEAFHLGIAPSRAFPQVYAATGAPGGGSASKKIPVISAGDAASSEKSAIEGGGADGHRSSSEKTSTTLLGDKSEIHDS